MPHIHRPSHRPSTLSALSRHRSRATVRSLQSLAAPPSPWSRPGVRKSLVVGLLATLAGWGGWRSAHAACPPVDASNPPAVVMDQALWPADVLRSAEAAARQPADPAQWQRAQATRQGAEQALAALQRRDVKLQRNAFCDAAGTDEARQAEVRAAARGDAGAAYRIARRYRDAQAQQPDAMNRYEAWLQYAAALGQETASYELALHYRRTGQPIYAAVYEARAVEGGFIVPVALDNVRK